MPRPEEKIIQLTVDGREIKAVEGSMLVDAAKFGDVEIPYFCYEPKLGHPVGACRMCLVEIEGIPKLQTSCSTPVKDGMVVHTQTERVRHAQNAVVEFLLVNHPLDCPVCDKGGECPLQDITFGWGGGRSRFIEPKRHFEKPLALSPLIAIDRERCILCYRCVRFSQEVAEDYQLIFSERGAHTFVTTFDGHPYVAPFSGNIIELCPVGALTSQPYRFRARPWDIENAGGICTLCPSQCNVTFTVRDENVARVLAREHDEVDDGWLCDKGRFAYQAIHVDERITAPLVRDGGELRTVSWERALEAAGGLAQAPGRASARSSAARPPTRRASCCSGCSREALELARHRLARRRRLPVGLARALARPALQATVPDLEFAHAVLVLGCEPLDDAPILDLRIRKGVRRRGVRLAVATARPSALDANAQTRDPLRARRGRRLLAALDVRSPANCAAGGEDVARARRAAPRRRRGHRDRLGRADRRRRDRRALLELADAPRTGRPRRRRSARGPRGRQRPRPARGRRRPRRRARLRRPRRRHRTQRGRDRAGRRRRRASPRFTCSAPTRFATSPTAALWERALHSRGAWSSPTPLPHRRASASTPTWSSRPSPTPRRRAPSSTPTAAFSGCAWRSPTPAQIRAGWSVLAELAKRCGLDTGVLTSGDGVRAAVRRGPVLRRAHARRDRRPRRALAGARAGSGTAATAAPHARRRRRRAPNGAAPQNGALAARHLPLDLGRARGRGLAGAAFRRRPPAASSSRPWTPSGSGIADGDDVMVVQNGNAALRARAAVAAPASPEGTRVPGRRHRRRDSANALTAPTIEIAKP